VLTLYFSCLKKRDFQAAYALITAVDKKNITPEDFIKWQSGVSRIYSLQEYSYKAVKLDTTFGIADRLAMLIDGQILAVGTPDEVRRSPNPIIQEFLTAESKLHNLQNQL
jgi:hypothetical protein